MQTYPSFPAAGYLRLAQIIGNPKANPPIPPIIPVSKSTWWAGVKSGRYPPPVKLGARVTAWPVESVRALIKQIGEAHTPQSLTSAIPQSRRRTQP